MLWILFCALTYNSLNAQSVAEKLDVNALTSNQDNRDNKLGGKIVPLDRSQDLFVVIADTNLRFSLKHPLLSSVLTPFPIQTTPDGQIIPYSSEEWESMISRLGSTSEKRFDQESFLNQFFTVEYDFLNLGEFEQNLNPIIAQPWLALFMKQQVQNEFEYIVKSQTLLGNVCIIDPQSGLPSSANIIKNKKASSSPNAMLAYTALFNRWLFARPSQAYEILKKYRLPKSAFSDPVMLCQTFAPELLPSSKANKK